MFIPVCLLLSGITVSIFSIVFKVMILFNVILYTTLYTMYIALSKLEQTCYIINKKKSPVYTGLKTEYNSIWL